MKAGTERDCELRAEGLGEIVEALRIALADWQELQARAQAEGLDISAQAQEVKAQIDTAARLIGAAS
jgi:hypothetical protein